MKSVLHPWQMIFLIRKFLLACKIHQLYNAGYHIGYLTTAERFSAILVIGSLWGIWAGGFMTEGSLSCLGLCPNILQ
jgi:hypothetical protein